MARGRPAIRPEDVSECVENKKNRLVIFTREWIVYVNTKTGRPRWRQPVRNVVDVIGNEKLKEVTINFRYAIRVGCCLSVHLPHRKLIYCKSPEVQQNLHKYLLSLIASRQRRQRQLDLQQRAEAAGADGPRTEEQQRQQQPAAGAGAGAEAAPYGAESAELVARRLGGLSIMRHVPLPGADRVRDGAPVDDSALMSLTTATGNLDKDDVGESMKPGLAAVGEDPEGEGERGGDAVRSADSVEPSAGTPRSPPTAPARASEEGGASASAAGAPAPGPAPAQLPAQPPASAGPRMLVPRTGGPGAGAGGALTLTVSAMRSLCIDLLTRIGDDGARRAAGSEAGGLLAHLCLQTRALMRRAEDRPDASRERLLESLVGIFDGMAARSDAEFTRDLQMLIGLATIFLGDSGSIVNGDFVRSPEMTPMKASAVAGDADRLAPMMSL